MPMHPPHAQLPCVARTRGSVPFHFIRSQQTSGLARGFAQNVNRPPLLLRYDCVQTSGKSSAKLVKGRRERERERESLPPILSLFYDASPDVGRGSFSVDSLSLPPPTASLLGRRQADFLLHHFNDVY